MLQKLFSTFRTNLISGALALIPLVAVVWIVAWLWGLVEGFRDFFPMGLDPRVFFGIQDVIALALLNWLITIVVLVAIVLFVAIVGLVSRNILGRRILAVVHHFVNRIPVLSAVYSTLEQLLDTFASNKGKSFRRVVLVEFPRTGIWTIGLVTGIATIAPSPTPTRSSSMSSSPIHRSPPTASFSWCPRARYALRISPWKRP